MALFSLMAKLGLDLADYQAGMKRAESAAAQAGGAIKGHIKGMAGDVKGYLAGMFTFGAVKQFVGSVIEAGDRIGDLADLWHLSVEEVQKIEILAGRTGVKAERIGDALVRFSALRQKAKEGDKESADLLSKYGVSLSEVRDDNKSNLELVTKLSTKYSEVSDSAEAQADALEIAGEKGQKVLSVLTQINDLGPITLISKEEIAAISGFADSLDELKRQATVAAAPKLGFWADVFKRANELERGDPNGTPFSNALIETLFGWNPNTAIKEDMSLEPLKTAKEKGRASLQSDKLWQKLNSLDWSDRAVANRKWSWAGQLLGSDNPLFDFWGRSTGEQFGPLEKGQTWEMLQAGKAPMKSKPRKRGERFDLPSTGSLAAIGGLYFGADYNTRLMSTAEKQVRELEKISTNTKDAAESLKQ